VRISVFGLGYVGAVTSACLAREGFTVVGVDVNPDKVAMIASGQAPIIELGLSDLLRTGAQTGRLRATTSAAEAVKGTDVSLVSVGTPSRPDGSLDLSHVFTVCREIGAAIALKGAAHVVVIRSTMLPGGTARCAEVLREHAGTVPVAVAFNPEFLREGNAIRDFDSPPYTIIGTTDPVAERAVKELYTTLRAPVIVTEPAVAEMIKLASNAWHAAKITFANEIGRIAKAVGADGRAVMEIFVQDTRLNVSPAYFRPGFAYGGSCLPKDVRALTSFVRTQNLELPLLCALPDSNRVQIETALRQVQAINKQRIGLLGLAFKPGTDDLRESPAVELAERLIGKGYDLRILDSAVRQAKLIGANREYIEKRIPHLSSLLVASAAELVRHAEAVVVAHGAAEFREVIELIGPDAPIIDLAGLLPTRPEGKVYDGIAW
jgi:GDP-mannose 6-dehydrogenase